MSTLDAGVHFCRKKGYFLASAMAAISQIQWVQITGNTVNSANTAVIQLNILKLSMAIAKFLRATTNLCTSKLSQHSSFLFCK